VSAAFQWSSSTPIGYSTSSPVAVSLTSLGSVRIGAGTTVYTSPSQTILTGSCPLYLDLDAIFNGVYIVSSVVSTSSAAKASTLSVISTNQNGSNPTTLSTLTIDSQVFELTTLNKNTGLFVYITQDFSSNQNLSTVVAGTVNPSNGYQINLGLPGTLYYTGTYTVDPIITRLSDTTFAILYYSYYPEISLLTKYGNLIPLPH
jgi:hypothetical protein